MGGVGRTDQKPGELPGSKAFREFIDGLDE